MLQLPTWVDAAITLVVLAAAIYSFVRERIPAAMTAVFALLALQMTGVLSIDEAFGGFSHPATLSVAAVLVLSAGLERTGALAFVARHILSPLAGTEWLLTLVLMVLVGTLSAFINNTAVVAVFIPTVLAVCRRSGASAGRVLMPMSHAATLGGMCTLMGTSTNLAAHEYAISQGLKGFGMFELGSIGLPMLVVGFAYVLLVGRRFLPSGSGRTPEEIGRSGVYLSAVMVPAGAPWVGREIRPDQIARDFDVELLDVLRDRISVLQGPSVVVHAGDRLRVRGPLDRILSLTSRQRLEIHRPADTGGVVEGSGQQAESTSVLEVVVLPGSDLIGRSLKSYRFADRFGAIVIAIHRPGEGLGDRPEDTPLRGGDVLAVEGDPAALKIIGESRGFLSIGAPALPDKPQGKIWIAVITLVGVILAVSLGWAPIVTAAAAGCALLILTGCLRPRQAYGAIDLSIVFLLAGALALGTAIEKTGLAAELGELLARLTHLTGPHALLVGFFLIAMVLSELMSNSGTVLLLGPVAVSSAQQLGINPMALLAAVTFGASAAFAMPIGYQTSLMIYGPGGYKFRDFVRMGVPLDLLLAALALWLIPRFWPLILP